MQTTYYIIRSRPVILESSFWRKRTLALDWENTGEFVGQQEFLKDIRYGKHIKKLSKEGFDAYVKMLLADEPGNPDLRVNEDDLELVGTDSGGTPIWHWQGQPFTGKLLAFEKDGTLAFEQGCVDGCEDGWYRSYHSNGQKAEEYKQLFNELIHGTHKKWNENGDLLPRVNESELKMIGFDGGGGPIWHWNDRPFTGTLVCCEDDGSLAYEQGCVNGYEDGWHRSYHPNGQKDEEYNQLDNNVVSHTYKRWDDQGNLLESW